MIFKAGSGVVKSNIDDSRQSRIASELVSSLAP